MDEEELGTTFLHLDKSRAVNIMLHSFNHQVSAHWHIWPRSSISALGKLISPNETEESWHLATSIVGEMAFIDPAKIGILADLNELPWMIEQQPGEAVSYPQVVLIR